MVIAALRLSLATAVLVPLVLARRRAELRSMARSELRLALLSGLLLGIHFATWITSLAYTSVASSVVLVSTAPLIVGLLSPSLLGEPLTRQFLAGLSAALVGIVLVGLSDACTLSAGLVCPALAEFVQGRAFTGDLLAFAGALAGAGYFMLGRRLRPRLALEVYIFIAYGAAAIFLLISTLVTGGGLAGYSAKTYLWIALLALLPQLVGHTAFNWALRYLPATYVTLTTLGEPIGSAALAAVLLQEAPPPARLLGGACILLGIVIASRQPRLAE